LGYVYAAKKSVFDTRSCNNRDTDLYFNSIPHQV